ncbi:MAG: TonB-dependent receptor [Bacteroidia bacterium]|nr:TonB-dependent receptor [Bacteroidia bacterium]
MNINNLLLALFWLLPFITKAQSSIQGTVKDESGEPVVDARVELLPTPLGTLTNVDGIFSFSKIQAGNYTLRITFLGMDTLNYPISVPPNKNLTLNLVLREKITQLETIEVVGQKLGEIDKIRITPGVTKVSMRDINLIPTLGAPDLAQYLQVLPGVVFTGDQGGQLFIRGGTPIQNMVLMDGAIIYNPFHSIGLFSVFDTDYIRTVDVYSAGFSAEFGGRISSVLDLKTRNGNFKEQSGKIHLNTLTTGALLEGPIAKGSRNIALASYLVSARHCFLEQSSRTLYSYMPDTMGLPFNFTDLYGKVTLGSGYNQISLFGFFQRDAVNYSFPTQYNWYSYGGGTNFMFIPPSTSVIISGNISYTDFINKQRIIDERFPRESKIGGFSSRFNFSFIYNSINDLNLGFQILGFQTEYKFTNSLGLSASQPVNYNTEAAGYVKLKHVLRTRRLDTRGQVIYFNRWVLEPSIRLHYYNEQGRVSFEPRFRAKLNFHRISFQLASGL